MSCNSPVEVFSPAAGAFVFGKNDVPGFFKDVSIYLNPFSEFSMNVHACSDIFIDPAWISIDFLEFS